MTKSIDIVESKPEKKKRKPSTVTDKKKIATYLEGYTKIKNLKEATMLIPFKTHIKYVNKEDKALRVGGLLMKVNEQFIVLKSNSFTWRISMEKNNIYAKSSGQDDAEKLLFVNFLEEQFKSEELKVFHGRKRLTWEQLLEHYANLTL